MQKIHFTLLSVALIFIFSCGNTPTAIDRPNVILIIIDTLRADHLSCYGYCRDTSPSLDSLAAAGTRWENCQAQAPWTLPSTATIFTGLNAKQHGTGRRLDGDHRLHSEVPIIPTIFSDAGYRTCGIFNVVLLNENHGFSRGFDHYSCNDLGARRAALTVNEFLQWLESDNDERPFLAVLHFFDVHTPYDPPPPYDNMYFPDDTLEVYYWEITDDGRIVHPEHLEHFLSRYDGGITWVDTQLGRLFSELRLRGYADSTIIMVAADHGEEFLEWGWVGHGGQLYQELLHVPLFMSGPGIPAGEIIMEPAGLFDILPTLLSICSIENTTCVEGVDLFSLAARDIRPLPASQLMFPGLMLGETPIAAVVYGSMKGLVTREGSTDSYYMFDLQTVSGERIPLEADSTLMELLDYYRATPMLWDPPRVQDLDSSSTRVLEDLGYI
ncbi:MAG: sulfatase [Candidatus Aegiribacteria sp.]|nr:sulfatase [Candidatus Aegiribacteria sp.]